MNDNRNHQHHLVGSKRHSFHLAEPSSSPTTITTTTTKMMNSSSTISTNTTSTTISQEEALDSIQALLCQEEKYYRCEDYIQQQFQLEQQQQQVLKQQQRQQLSSSSSSSSTSDVVLSPLHVVAEIANLVTDGRLTPTSLLEPVAPSSSLLAKSSHHHHHVSSPTSVVVKPPTARRIQDLLYSSSSSSSSLSTYSNNNNNNINRGKQQKQQHPPTTNFDCTVTAIADNYLDVASTIITAAAPSSYVVPLQQQLEQSRFAIWRRQMFDWSCAVTDSFQIPRDVVAMAFDILDRYVALECNTDELLEVKEADDDDDDDDDWALSREDFQLFAMVSLYMAIKTNLSYRKLSVNVLIEMSRGFYSVQDVLNTERDILQALAWHVHPPTVMTFCRLYMELFPSSSDSESSDHPLIYHQNNKRMEVSCQVLSELVVADSYFINKSSASVALAVVLLTARREGRSVLDTNQFMHYLESSSSSSSSSQLGGRKEEQTNLLCDITTSSASQVGGDFESILRRLESLLLC